MFNIFRRNTQKRVTRVRNTTGEYARKVKVGGMESGHFYMPSKRGFKKAGK